MTEVRETRLPGVGVRYEFTTSSGQDVGVIVHHDGRREVLVYDQVDPDSCTSMVSLTESDSQTLGEILGVSHVNETVAAVRHDIEGLAIEWVDIDDDSSAVGTSIGAGAFRSETGASVVAVMRGNRSVPAPGPEFVFEAGDVVVAVGTHDGLLALRRMLSP
jgi:TrkA domain protein